MIVDDPSDGRRGNRPVLAEVTNRPGKRQVLSISGSPDLGRGNEFRNNVEGKVPDSGFVKKVCMGVENIVGGKCKRDCVEDGNSKGLPLAKPMGLCSSLKSGTGRDSLNGDKLSSISGVHGEIKDLPTVVDGAMHFVRNDGSRDSCISGVKGSEQCEKSGSPPSVIVGGGSQGDKEDKEHVKADVGRDATGSILEKNVVDAHVCGDVSELMDCGNLTSTKSNLTGSSSSKFSEPEICASSGNADDSNANHGVDMLKDCSCSFCLKAAYIWSDLHFQDVKGRIAALKKSRQEVKICVDRSLNRYETDKNSMANLNKSKELELDLMGKWKSLFLHTEDILICENSQLQSSLLSLKELRGNCKMDLEMNDGMPLKK
ncbi:uncharacterized protein LOC122088311 [Macadamia integrifolia]|uniref:uncharacterized protein LOC122088311 n=1 Tax=Macadamia integrifolia TaxID=60698 RepID=UPI001C4FBAD8|nr:uncharacterized protein LOC122088311 [Macadamia integrifolia]XP_042513461.1 uncharacterized protein LOC122088311 [Macadamia integrifolia]XP_042513462.1 uncharacterized protein LOC122088311 [Macadamia integrifolia]